MNEGSWSIGLGTRLARHPAHQSDTEIERSATTAHQGPMLDKDEWLASEAAAVGKCGLLPHFGCGNSVRSRDALRASCMSGGSREDGHALAGAASASQYATRRGVP